MYPYILIGDYKLYMVSVGIFLSIVIFLIIVWKLSKRYKLNFWSFFVWFPIFLFLMYFFWSYVYVVLNYKVFFPFSLEQIVSLFFPLGYKFHFIGLSFWFMVAFLLFLFNQKTYIDRLKWIDVIFYSLMISFFILWIFLTLGDNFIWKPTDSEIGVSSLILCNVDENDCFKPISKIDDFIAVHPVWLYFSLVSLIVLLLTLFFNFLFKRFGFWLLGFVMFLMGLNFVFLFQQYPRYLPFIWWDYTLDIKNYWTVALILFIVLWFILVYIKHKKLK